MISRALAAFLILASFAAQAQSVSIPNESRIELSRFEVNGQELSPNFIRDFPGRVHQEILTGEKNFLKALNGKCRDSVKVTFGPQILENKNTVETIFEDGLVKVEASKCFDNAEPSRLIEISADDAFKRRAFSTLVDISSEKNQSCESTHAPTIGNSYYCYLNFDFERSADVHSQVNFLVFNGRRKSSDVPVYFREAFVSARRMGAQTLYYVHSYVRSTQLSSFKKIFAEKYIQSSQERVFNELQGTLNRQQGAGR